MANKNLNKAKEAKKDEGKRSQERRILYATGRYQQRVAALS